MKLNIYQQDNSNIQWVRDEPWTLEEMLDLRVKFVGYANADEYEHQGMGYYRKRQGYAEE